MSFIRNFIWRLIRPNLDDFANQILKEARRYGIRDVEDSHARRDQMMMFQNHELRAKNAELMRNYINFGAVDKFMPGER